MSSIVGEKKYLYRYIDTIGYDMYEQRKYMKYGNGVKTEYAYSPNRRRLESLTVASKGVNIMDNTYTYDVMDNIVRLVNNGVTQVGKDGKTIGGYTSHSYSYDKWNRLTNAMGSFRPNATDSAHYNLAMTYDKLYNVTSKKLDLIQENLQFAGRLETGHEFTYHYDKENTFKLLDVSAKEYTSDSAVVDTFMRVHHYDFDANGNQTMVAMNPIVNSSCVVDTAGTKVRQLLWDEENRLLSINDNGFVSNYFYDVNGERTVKLSMPDLSVFVNGVSALDNDSALMKFVGYVSPYLVVTNGGRYTKHIYAGTQRIASKMGDIESFGEDPRRVQTAGAGIKEIDFGGKYDMQNAALFARYDSFNVDNKPKENSDYVGGQSFCCGKAKGEYSNNNSKKSENAQFEGDTRFYHPDHLGSTTVVTDLDGEVTQNVAYIPYGEVFVEQRNGTWNTPYLFNAKELDEETGLYYYGARYLDPTNVAWLSVDPLFEKYVGMTPYGYCEGNPVRFVDPNGKSTHTSEDGTVIAVNNDGDLGVYKHKKDETNTAKYKFKELNVKKNYEFSKVFYDGEKMGETEYWDEFINPETNKFFDGMKIKFGEDFMPTIEDMHKKSLDMNLAEIAKESSPTGLFDIKLKLGNVGALLNGKYATSRSAGNFLAGYNAESGRLMGVSITYETFQKLSGALHIESSRHKKLSKSQMAQIVLRGKYSGCSDEKSFNTPPTYGEVQYQYRMSVMGWNYGKKKR